MVTSLARLAPAPVLPTAQDDVLRTRLLRDHQRLGRSLTALLEDLAQLACVGLASASCLQEAGAQPQTPAGRDQVLRATRVLTCLTTISDQVMQARRRVMERIAPMQSATGPAGCARDADEEARERARAQAVRLLQGFRAA